MAISVINQSWRRLNFGDSTTNWVNDGGASIAANLDFYLSNSSSIADSLAKNQSRGWAYNIGAASGPIDLRDKVLSFWFLCNVAGFLVPISQGGVCITLTVNGSTFGQGNAGNFEYYVAGNDTYTGGWIKLFIDPSKEDSNGNRPTPGQLASISHVGMFFRTGNNTIPGNLDNTFIDSIDIHNRNGLNIIGTSSNVFEDLYQIDNSGTGSPAGPIGIFTKEDGIYLSNSRLLFGSGSQTTDVTGLSSTVVFLNPTYSGSTTGIFPQSASAPLSPALECGGLGYHISGTNTKVQFGLDSLVKGVTTLTAGLRYECLFDPSGTGLFYGSKFNKIGAYAGTGNDFLDFASLETYDNGGTNTTGIINIPNSNYSFYNCQFNDCNRILVNDSVWVGGFITDYSIRSGEVGRNPERLGAVLIDTSFNMTDVNFIGNETAIQFIESGEYPFNLFFSNNLNFSGTEELDVVNYPDYGNPPGPVIILYQGGDVPFTGTEGQSQPLAFLGATVDIEFVVTLNITGFVDGSELFMRDATTATNPIVTRFNENLATGSYQYVYSDPGSSVDLFVLKNKLNPSDTGYQWLSFRNFTLPQDNQSLQIFQIVDRNYDNP